MARRRRTAVGIESLEDLARKAEILERELAVQRQALEKLKQMGPSRPRDFHHQPILPAARKTA
jgi:hypothetical protein